MAASCGDATTSRSSISASSQRFCVPLLRKKPLVVSEVSAAAVAVALLVRLAQRELQEWRGRKGPPAVAAADRKARKGPLVVAVDRKGLKDSKGLVILGRKARKGLKGWDFKARRDRKELSTRISSPPPVSSA